MGQGEAAPQARKGSGCGCWLAALAVVGLLVFAVTSCEPHISGTTFALWLGLYFIGRHLERQSEELAAMRAELRERRGRYDYDD